MPTRSRLVDDDLACTDCGSTVTPADRFCPACGTPNARTKFHPKFGPEVVRFEPEILEEVAAPGTPACPRCQRAITGGGWCGACGMDVAEAWERYEQSRSLQQWRDANRWTRPRFHPTHRLAWVLQATLVLGVLVAALVGVLDTWLLARATGRLDAGPTSATLLGARDDAELVAAALLVVGGVVLVVWMRRACANLPALAVGELRFGPGWAVWGWLVPVFNLFRPKQVMDDLWRGSDPEAAPFSGRWRSAPRSVWCGLWWGGLLLGAALGLAGHDLIASNAARRVSQPADVQVGLLVSGLAAFLLAFAAIALVVLVRQVVDRQAGRAARIERELAEAPEPEGEPVAAVVAEPATVAGADGRASALVHQDANGLYGRY